jgi:hypothetical protein
VTQEEPLFVKAFTLAQYYFGMYESKPYYFADSAGVFATTAPLTYATIYRNDVWRDHLLVLANMNTEAKETSLVVRSPERLGIRSDGRYVLLEVNDRKRQDYAADLLLKQGLSNIHAPGRGMKLFYLRKLPHDGPYHLWGGKRISEKWDAGSGKLTVELHGPLGLEETVLVGVGKEQVGEVRVSGKRSPFFLDSEQQVAHGKVVFEPDPIRIEVIGSAAKDAVLPEKVVSTTGLPSR